MKEPEFRLMSGLLVLILQRKGKAGEVTPEVILINILVSEMTIHDKPTDRIEKYMSTEKSQVLKKTRNRYLSGILFSNNLP